MKRTLKMPHRRVREGRTDYHQRLRLLKSGMPRFVARKSGNAFSCQLVEHRPAGDRTLVTATVPQLRKLGWKGHGGSLPSAYLVGYLCGMAAKKKGIAQAVADFGLYRSTKGSRLYASLKGAVDAGLSIPHAKEILPPEDRVLGKHIAAYADLLKKQSPEKYQRVFSAYLKHAFAPETIATHAAEIKKKIAG
ncbi:MAG: 50S ribosomal protein L18 [Candidatus Aenigmarchaeota archaeon]|nr:50S ribosomal protein L18 [Candidatus Aenigmarchaeota archaeon]